MFTWLCPCVHMAVSLCSHGCVLVSLSNTGQSASDLSFVFTWLCPCVHMTMSLCSHGCVLVFTWRCPCVHMAVSLCSHGCVLVSLSNTGSLHLTCPCVHMSVSLCSHGCVLASLCQKLVAVCDKYQSLFLSDIWDSVCRTSVSV